MWDTLKLEDSGLLMMLLWALLELLLCTIGLVAGTPLIRGTSHAPCCMEWVRPPTALLQVDAVRLRTG